MKINAEVRKNLPTSNLRLYKTRAYENLTAWDHVTLARHPKRPKARDYIDYIFDSFIELHGDRLYRDDEAIIGGIAKLGNQVVTVIAHQKGNTTAENIKYNFGMPHPEGYRKALRLMKQAEKFNRPVITFIDTPGAYPGPEAEERGQGHAIAECLRDMSSLKVPTLSIVIGEGGSGGALALGVSDQFGCYNMPSTQFCHLRGLLRFYIKMVHVPRKRLKS